MDPRMNKRAAAEYPHRLEAVRRGDYDCPVCCDTGITNDPTWATPESRREPLHILRPVKSFECSCCADWRLYRLAVRENEGTAAPAAEYIVEGDHSNWDGWEEEEADVIRRWLADKMRYTLRSWFEREPAQNNPAWYSAVCATRQYRRMR